MHERRAARERRRAREFEAFVAGAGGRLLHVAALLTAEPADACPAAERLLSHALTVTYAGWDRMRGEDPYDRARQELAARFARTAWRYREPRWARGRGHQEAGGGQPGSAGRWLSRLPGRLGARLAEWWASRSTARSGRGPAARLGARLTEWWGDRLALRRLTWSRGPRTAWSGGGRLDLLTPHERLVLVLRLHEGIAEEQTAALLGLPQDRVRAVCTRAVTALLHTARDQAGAGVRARRPRAGDTSAASPGPAASEAAAG
ncbi:sigma factor-like helix-turn-helix DNA-binding protein [Streptomyces palmae]|uniref:sigma factor-like helix-turn-helix DNA-binding protein n=1 Tax=Streptomyces palmae TaxID=1701085 RepID=UPI0035EB02E5